MGHYRQSSLGIKRGTSEGWQMRQVLSADIQIHDVNQCETPPYPTPPLPHPACSLSCLKLTLSASQSPQTRGGHTQTPTEGSQDFPFWCLVAAPSKPSSKLPSQTAAPFPNVWPGGSADQKGGS